MTNELIKITSVNDNQKFASIKLAGLEDGLLVGLAGEGLSIAYKGEVKQIKFKPKEQ